MNNLNNKFKEAYEELVKAIEAKEEYEYLYSQMEARKMFSDEVAAFGNQTQRDAQLKLLLKEEYLKLVNVRTDYRIAYYNWNTLKTLIEGGDR